MQYCAVKHVDKFASIQKDKFYTIIFFLQILNVYIAVKRVDKFAAIKRTIFFTITLFLIANIYDLNYNQEVN